MSPAAESDDPDGAPADRLVGLEGGVNFRDIGGYPTANGGTVRWRRVYRSAALHRLTAADLVTVGGLGLRVVFDLRADEERESAPSVLPPEVSVEWLPIGGAAATISGLSDLIVDGRLAELPDDFLVRIYAAMIEHAAPTFGDLLTRLATPGGLPALFHCTAGKDRTGLVAALLLSVLGVDESIVLDDYELSAVHFAGPELARLKRRLAESDIDVERYRVVFDAPRQAMATALAAVRESHGTAERYLIEAGGMAPDALSRLRSVLVSRPVE